MKIIYFLSRISEKLQDLRSQYNLKGTIGFNGHLSKHNIQMIKFREVFSISNPHGNTH